MKRLNPQFAPFVTVPMAVVFNGLQIVLCVLAIGTGPRLPLVGMSVAGLLLVNGLIHVGSCVRAGRYAPGVLTGLSLYLPLSTYAYLVALTDGTQPIGNLLVTIALGMVFQLLPVGYLSAASRLRRGRS